jgi:hypothetical protein
LPSLEDADAMDASKTKQKAKQKLPVDVRVFPTFHWDLDHFFTPQSHVQPWFSSNSLEKVSGDCHPGLVKNRIEVASQLSSESGWDRVNLEDVDEVLDVVVAPGTAFL